MHLQRMTLSPLREDSKTAGKRWKVGSRVYFFVQPTSQQHIQHDPYVKSCVYLLASSTQPEVRIEYTGGNQRELARQKNLKKQQKQNKGKPDLKGMSVNQKKEK